MPDGPRYDEDFYAWTQYQAEVLRSMRTRDNRFDREHVAGEIEDLGKSDRRELRSQIRRIIRHLAKLQFSPAHHPRRGWHESIVDGRSEVELILRDSPSLKRQRNRIVADETGYAVKLAIFDLGEFGEIDPSRLAALRNAQYTVDQVLGDWFPPGPPRGAEEP